MGLSLVFQADGEIFSCTIAGPINPAATEDAIQQDFESSGSDARRPGLRPSLFIC